MLCAVVIAQGRDEVASTGAIKLKCNVHSLMLHSNCIVISASRRNQRHELSKQLSIKWGVYISTVIVNSMGIV